MEYGCKSVNEYNLNNLRRFSDISDNDMNELVRTFLREHGNFVGFSLVYGHLESNGIHVQQMRVRESIK